MILDLWLLLGIKSKIMTRDLGAWYFAERNLILDWSETRPSTPEPIQPRSWVTGRR